MEKLLDDLWLQMQEYYDSIVALLPKLILALIVFLIFYLLSNRIRKVVRRSLTERMDDPLLASFLAKTAKALMVVTGGLIVLKIVGLGATAGSLMASAGVGAFILGFAFKDIGENFLAGILLAFNRPFKVGDIVLLEGIEGRVSGLSLRSIQIKTPDGRDVFIPNASIIKQPLVNLTIDGDLRFEFTLGFDYGSDMENAQRVILDTLMEIPGIMTEPRRPFVMIKDLGASTLNMTCYYWIDAFNPEVSAPVVKNLAVTKVLAALTEAGYYLPSDILEIKNYRETDLKAMTKSNNT